MVIVVVVVSVVVVVVVVVERERGRGWVCLLGVWGGWCLGFVATENEAQNLLGGTEIV